MLLCFGREHGAGREGGSTSGAVAKESTEEAELDRERAEGERGTYGAGFVYGLRVSSHGKAIMAVILDVALRSESVVGLSRFCRMVTLLISLKARSPRSPLVGRPVLVEPVMRATMKSAPHRPSETKKLLEHCSMKLGHGPLQRKARATSPTWDGPPDPD